MSDKRTTLRISDERARLFDKAEEIVAADRDDSPPRSDVIDAALTHLIESKSNMKKARDDGISPDTIQRVANTSVLKLHYRTYLDSTWR